MTFNAIDLANFRSYKVSHFDFGAGLNLVIGPNGAGKTNLLEALYVLATTRSFRTSQTNELVANDQKWFSLTAELNKDVTLGAEMSVTYQYQMSSRSKKLKYGEQVVAPIAHLGKIPLVLFEPGMLAIVKGPPQWRRQYLNTILAVLNCDYFKALVNYHRVLKQRNNLLHSRSIEQVRREVFAWDLKLAEFANIIYSQRQSLVDFLNQRLSGHYASLTGIPSNPTLTYRSSVPVSQGQDYASALVERLTRNLNRDRTLGFTTAGPHRDDLAIWFKSTTAAKIASRGETRTLILALILAELDFVSQIYKTKPTLLLDDVFSELDNSHRQHLLKALGKFQTIITATDTDGLKLSGVHIIKLQ